MFTNNKVPHLIWCDFILLYTIWFDMNSLNFDMNDLHYYSVVYWIELYCTALYCIKLTWSDIIGYFWYDMIWFDLIWLDQIKFGQSEDRNTNHNENSFDIIPDD